MNKFLKNFNDLYSDDDQAVYQAIQEKKDWILTDLYLPGDLSISTDEEGSKHFRQLEDLLNDRVALDVYPFMDNIYQNMNMGFKSLRYKVLFRQIKKHKDYPFWIHYDFRKLSRSNYQKLVANFYPRQSEETLAIGESDFASMRDAMKLLMIGEEDEAIIILHVDDLQQAYLEMPPITEIIVHSSALDEVKTTLKAVAQAKNCGFKEENYE